MTFSPKLLKSLLFPAANIIVSIFLISAFFMAGQNVTQTFVVARMAALNNLKPQPMDYLWELNIHQAPLDKNKIRYYADYYEHLIESFPSLWAAYGLLGYCYHYLNDDPKAVRFLKTALDHDPVLFWNNYNLAVIYIQGSRYHEASAALQKALKADPRASLKIMFTSAFVYLPLFGPDGKKDLDEAAKHLEGTYRRGFMLMQILDQADHRKEARDMLKKFTGELYAF